MSSPAGLRRVKGSASLSFNAQVAAVPQNFSPPQAPQKNDLPYSLAGPQQPATQRPDLKSSVQATTRRRGGDHPHRKALVYDGELRIPQSVPALDQPLSKPHTQIIIVPSKKPRNKLKKAQNLQSKKRRSSGSKSTFFELTRFTRTGLRHFWRRPMISGPMIPFHLEGRSPRPVLRSEHFVLGEKTSDASQFAEAHYPEEVRASRDGLAKYGENFPLRSHPVQVIVTPEPVPKQIPAHHSVTSKSSSTHSSRPTNLTVERGWEIEAHKEHKQNCYLRKRLEATEMDLQQTRERYDYLEPKCASLEAELNAERATATQQRLFAGAWQRSHEAALATIAALKDELQILHSQSEQRQQTEALFPEEENFAAPSATSVETFAEELSATEPPILTVLAANQAASNDAEELFLPSASDHVTLALLPERRQELPSQAGPHELSATRSHQVLPRIFIGEPQSPAEASAQEDEDIPYNPLELADLRSNFNDLFSRAEGRDQEDEDETIPSLVTESRVAEQNLESFSLETESRELEGTSYPMTQPVAAEKSPKDFSRAEDFYEPSTGSSAAVYRFGSRRVTTKPAVFRTTFESKSDRELSPETKEFFRIQTFEWCSIPDLKLGI